MKSITDQNADRAQRAEDQLPLYLVTLCHLAHRPKDGSDPFQRLVFAVRKRDEYLRPGENAKSYFVTDFGCCCPDALRAKKAGIQRECKHARMTRLWLAEQAALTAELFDGPDEYCHDDDAAEDTLSLLATGRPSREELRRRMNEDFGPA